MLHRYVKNPFLQSPYRLQQNPYPPHHNRNHLCNHHRDPHTHLRHPHNTPLLHLHLHNTLGRQRPAGVISKYIRMS